METSVDNHYEILFYYCYDLPPICKSKKKFLNLMQYVKVSIKYIHEIFLSFNTELVIYKIFINFPHFIPHKSFS